MNRLDYLLRECRNRIAAGRCRCQKGHCEALRLLNVERDVARETLEKLERQIVELETPKTGEVAK